MSIFLERVISRNFQESDVVQGATRLSGGIDKDIYKVPVVRDGVGTAFAIAIFRNPNDWWKIDQEAHLREITGGDKETGIPGLVEVGFDCLDGQKYAFIIRDFIEGHSLHELLSQIDQQSSEVDIGALAADLGHKLATLHRHRLDMFGMMGKPSDVTDTNWGHYVFGKIEYYFRALHKTSPEKRVGKVYAGDIVGAEQKLYAALGTHQSSLFHCGAASIAHGDAHLGNFIAGLDQNGRWKVIGVIDTEEALGADPEIDIAFIENWLFFMPYSELFYAHGGDFLSGYKRESPIPDPYKDRRYVYHALRSLSYLKALFTLDTEAIIRSEPKHTEFIEKHFAILKALAEGYTLEDLNIKSLI